MPLRSQYLYAILFSAMQNAMFSYPILLSYPIQGILFYSILPYPIQS